MDTPLALEKTVSLRTRDFCAESWSNKGQDFRVCARNGNGVLCCWWREHLYDNHRNVFKPDEDDELYLSCKDETEANALLMALQSEWNAVAI